MVPGVAILNAILQRVNEFEKTFAKREKLFHLWGYIIFISFKNV